MLRLSILVFATVTAAACAVTGPIVPDAGTAQSFSEAIAVVTVAAGEFDRHETIVSFAAPAQVPPAELYCLIGPSSDTIHVQSEPDGRLWFVLDNMPAGDTEEYRLEIPSPAPDRANAEASRREVRLEVDGLHLLTYNFRETELPDPDVDSIFHRGGYIHPVYTPSGVLLTDDYPPKHRHHHGIWAAWTRTRFKGRAPDFWNMGEGTGTVQPVALDAAWSGPVHAGVRARHRYVDLSGPEPETVLNETWHVRAFPVGGTHRVFDLEVEQVLLGDSALHLPEYHYGGVGFRGHRQWDGAENTIFLTSEGRDRSDGHATRARWSHVGGYVDGRLAGISILGHPDNFEAPQPMRIHPDEPFFNYAPSQAGDWAIRPGETYRARYRYVVYDGEPDIDLIERVWNDYAHPPAVTVTPIGSR